jgi:Icc-related predicted phosphoesterase
VQILLVADLHYTLRQLDWVASVAGDYDLLVVAGDLLDIASAVEPDAQIAMALEYLTRFANKTTVVACSGNHDLNARNDLDELSARWLEPARAAGVVVDGMRVETDDLLVTACPWWDGPRTRDAVDAQLAADAAVVRGRQWLWVYHAPPDGSPTSWTGKRHYGDEDLTRWISRHRPDVVMCGHVHQSPFADGGSWIDRHDATVVCNPGRQPGPIPAHIELDTTAGIARWLSIEGVDEQTLIRA